uniref:Uncharacterized protein n=1 Tax=uncultured marine thaumarchaeote KM3_43_G12 TaxID=1456151 RepID=A0A075H6U9_9ARCH|nr:hypothetical protein [uncultured marine thaumarchaeote KM3_43_G12]
MCPLAHARRLTRYPRGTCEYSRDWRAYQSRQVDWCHESDNREYPTKWHIDPAGYPVQAVRPQAAGHHARRPRGGSTQAGTMPDCHFCPHP